MSSNETIDGSARQRPGRLEINSAGSWKLVAKFDLAHPAGRQVLEASLQLALALADASLDGGGPTLRVSTDEAHPQSLMHYDGKLHQWQPRSRTH